ncbi:hypothetical protein MCUN1_002961 [Malassezia cuniculi]|uniref:Inositol polyphosphate-related phosphatase domain-containing protein n=1 Tax=Malassezia cuniculi TaxID=948313 RepID=A0AAF0J7G9_9BASI|nr:hypothetical protein MCUN1_002961 [Malassezia cuniculi]
MPPPEAQRDIPSSSSQTPSTAEARTPEIASQSLEQPTPSMQDLADFTSSAAAYLVDAEYSGSESEDADDEAPPQASSTQVPIDQLPEFTSASRRAPLLDPPRSTQFRSAVQASDMFGDTHAFANGDKIRIIQYGSPEREGNELIFAQTAEHYVALGSPASLTPTSKELRATTLAFPPTFMRPADSSEPYAGLRTLWYGTTNGHLAEVDITTGTIVALRPNVHTGAIVMLTRVGRSMVCLDETGKISAWVPRGDEPLSLANSQPRTQRITLQKNSYATMAIYQLWVCSMVQVPKSNPMQAPVRVLNVRIYNPISDDRPFNAVSRPLTLPTGMGVGVGAVTCSAVLPAVKDRFFLGHDSGHISIWSISQCACLSVEQVFSTAITSMAAVHTLLWFGLRDGHIRVYSMEANDMVEVKGWQAHRDAVVQLRKDRYGFRSTPGLLQIMSVGADNVAYIWDAMLTDEWFQSEMQKRMPQCSTYRLVRILQLTYNIGAAPPASMFGAVENMEVFQRILRSACNGATGPDYIDPNASPDIVVCSLQEVIALDDTRLTAKRFLLGKKKRAGSDFDDRVSNQYRAWYDKLVSVVRLVMPPEAPYTVLNSENMVGLFSIVFVKSALLPRIRDATTYKIKTGLGGRYGNKGAIVSRFILDDSSFCFLNCHLAAGQRNVRQRNADVRDIMEHALSTSLFRQGDLAYVHNGNGSHVLDSEFCIVGGDLNYRLNLKRDYVVEMIEQQRFDELQESDQLHIELQRNPMFRWNGFQEAPIKFAPTYKFNRLTNVWDTSEKARVPAWCDRILWRNHTGCMMSCTSYRRWNATISDHRPVSATFVVRAKSIIPEQRDRIADELRTQHARIKNEIYDELEKSYDV